MQRVQFTFSCKTQLIFALNGTKTSEIWSSLLVKMQRRYLLRSDINHRHGFASHAEVRAGVARLKKCNAFLNFSIAQINKQNWHTVLNSLHINFPEFFKEKLAPKTFQAAHEMNLLIHWLEYELGNIYGHKGQYLFNLDFNHYSPAYNLKAKIPDDEFDLFSPNLQFGNLHLHYIYVGRHFLEMYDAQDLICPPSHFKAQHEFNATCGLVFSEPHDAVLHNANMQNYYDQRGGKSFFGFDYNDPKLAKGFFKLGQLENLHEYNSFEQRQALRDQLIKSQIVAWQFLE
jgi:hypothetical protein